MSHPWPIDRDRRREIDEGNQTQRELDRDEVTFPFQFGDKMFVTAFLFSLAYKARLTHPLGTQAADPSARRPCKPQYKTYFLSTPSLFSIRLLHGCDISPRRDLWLSPDRT